MEIICNLLGYTINRAPTEWGFHQKECVVVSCLNPHSYVTAKRSDAYRHALQSSDILLPDGEGIVFAARFLHGVSVSKYAGMDFQMSVLRQLNTTGGKVYYIGSDEATLERIMQRIGHEYPRIECRTALPSMFRHMMPERENAHFIKEIKDFTPDVVFVGLGTEKQEVWTEQNKESLTGSVGYIGNIGAAFGMFAGTSPRAPHLMIRLKLEWLYRFLKEPHRLWRRVFVSTAVFLGDVAHEKMRMLRSR